MLQRIAAALNRRMEIRFVPLEDQEPTETSVVGG